jgi:hypothetical protein
MWNYYNFCWIFWRVWKCKFLAVKFGLRFLSPARPFIKLLLPIISSPFHLIFKRGFKETLYRYKRLRKIRRSRNWGEKSWKKKRKKRKRSHENGRDWEKRIESRKERKKGGMSGRKEIEKGEDMDRERERGRWERMRDR